MIGNALHFALRELQSTYASPRALAIMAMVAVVLGLSGPFGTFAALPVGARLAYWAAIVFVTYGVGEFTGTFVAQLIGDRLRRPVLVIPIASAAAAVPVTLAVIAINLLAFGPEDGTRGWALVLWAYIFVIAMVVTIAGMVLAPSAAPSVPAAPQPPPVVPTEPALLTRLPLPQRGRLLSLSVEDHYVVVVTDTGRSILLMRLSDAIAETAPVTGLRIHRSHWVALDAVASVRRRDAGAVVTLVDGRELPIARGQMPAARAAGLIV